MRIDRLRRRRPSTALSSRDHRPGSASASPSSRTNDPADYERLAAGAEQYGFDVLSVFGDLYFPPPVPALLAMARATSAIALGPACLNPYMMHPVEIAGQMAALDLASGGRAFLGLCPGRLARRPRDRPAHAARRRWPRRPDRRRPDERRPGGCGRSRFVLPAGAALQRRPLRSSLPLLIGTWGPRLCRIGGSHRRRGEGRRVGQPRHGAPGAGMGGRRGNRGRPAGATPPASSSGR